MVSTKKPGNYKETVESAKKPRAKHSKPEENPVKAKVGGLDEIDTLFAAKKKQKQEIADTKAAAQKQKRKQHHNNKSSATQQPRTATSSTDWVNDGLGGKYNSEGYTGRVEDGVKVFKTHLLQSTKSGSTKDCPFDCDCCFI